MKLKISFFLMLFVLVFVNTVHAAPTQFIFDDANLLTPQEKTTLEQLAAQLSAETNTAIMILTTNNTGGVSIEKYMGDFYDANQLGYDQPNGNTVLLSIDMGNRDLYLAGFHKGEEYIPGSRIDAILDRITPLISSGNYYDAFNLYMSDSAMYLKDKPKNIFHAMWLSIVIALFTALMIVGAMISNRGGKVTISDATYNDSLNSGIVNKNDRYITTHITKVKRPKNNSGSGGGRTGGGTSYSGGGRSF